MKRLYLTVEGQTEEAFAMSILRPHLASFNVMLAPPRFTGLHGRRRGRVPRGGLLRRFQHTMADIERWLKGDRSADARFSMMVDLYHLPRDFPGYDKGMSKSTGSTQATSLEQSLAVAIDDDRFIPYLQVHEFEALVLSDPRRIATLYEVKSADIEALTRDCERHQSSEQINHGQHSHPKYRIHQRVPDYDENVAGPLLCESIGLEALRRCCPHFGQWLQKLEQLDTDQSPASPEVA